MNQIKFSHGTFLKFDGKIKNGDKVILVGVQKTRYENIPDWFKDMDTAFMQDKLAKAKTLLDFYKLPKSGDCLVFFFCKEIFQNGHSMLLFFPTIRDWEAEKEAHYLRNLFREFEVVIL